MSTNSNLPLIEKLKGRENYNTWQFAMKNYLELEDLWSCVEGKDETQDITQKSKRDKIAKSKIILMLDTINYIHVQNASSAKEVWDKLQAAFDDSGLLRKVNLIKTLIITRLENCESIEEYINKIISTAQKLNNIHFEITDEWLATFLLAGLSDEYKPMIMAMESSGVKLTSDCVKTKLLQEIKTKSTSVALFNKGKKKHFQKVGPRCFNCNNYGHLAKNCMLRKKTNSGQPSISHVRKQTSLYSSLNITSDPTDDATGWYIDSGASMHMTRNRD